MSYARNTFLNKQLPSYTGFFILVLALCVTLLLSKNTFTFISKATIGSEPKNVQISNISDTSFTISYTTDASAVGTINYGTDQSTPNIALDDRDQQASGAAQHQVHFITVKNLTPATAYYYVIDSGSEKADNNGQPFQITTAPSLAASSSAQPTVSGTVSLSDGTEPSESIVYLKADNSQQLAALVNPDGSYQVPLSSLRTSTFSDAATLTPDTVLQIQADTPTEQSTAKILESQASQVPKIIIPQNYDFTLGPSPIASDSGQTAQVSAFPVLATPAPVSSPEITSPTESQTLSDQQPTFQGLALPDQEIDVTIQSQQEITAKLQSNDSGAWQFRPPIKLAPGKHTITISSVDANGILQTISRSFTVYAAGSKFVEPSISPVASPSAPLLIATPTQAPTPTVLPTPTASPTAIPTTQPTSTTPAPTREPLPKTGSSAVVAGIIAAVTAIGIGALLFFAL